MCETNLCKCVLCDVPGVLRSLPLPVPLHLVHPQRLLTLLLLQRRLTELLKHVLGGLDGGRSDGLFHELRPRLCVIQNEALQKQTVLMFNREARDSDLLTFSCLRANDSKMTVLIILYFSDL